MTTVLDRFRLAEQPEPVDRPPTSWVRGAGSVIAILVGYGVLRLLIRATLLFDPSAYEQPVMLIEVLQDPSALAAIVALNVAVWIRPSRTSWAAMGDARAVRILVGGVCALLAWAFSSYDFNVFVGQAHLVDRLLLVALAVAVWLSPKAVALFLPHLLIIVSQFSEPLGTGGADKTLLFKFLMMFIVYLTLRLILDVPGRTFLFATGVLVAGNFVESGIGKLRIGWLRNELANLWIASWANGFPGWLSEDAALRIGNILDTLNVPFLVGTVIVEAGFLFLWWTKRAFYPLIAAGIFLHLAIFLSSGIFFWKWICLEVLLAVAVRMVGWERVVNAVGGRIPAIITSAALILTAPFYASPVRLAWFDSRVNYMFELEAVTPRGKIPIERHFFAPYDLTFSQNRFAFLSQEPVMTGTFATVTTLERMQTLAKVDSCAELDTLEESEGLPAFKPRRAREYTRFVTRYVSDSVRPEDRGIGWRVLEWVQGPPHIWVQTPPPIYVAGTDVTAVEVTRQRTIYLGDEMRRCSPEPLGRIAID